MDLDWQAEMFEVLRLEKEEIKTTSSKQQKDSRNQIIALRTAAASQQVRIGRAHAEIQQLCDELRPRNLEQRRNRSGLMIGSNK
jgi:hypothetical protein